MLELFCKDVIYRIHAKNVSPKYFVCYVLFMFIVFSCVKKPVSFNEDMGFLLAKYELFDRFFDISNQIFIVWLSK